MSPELFAANPARDARFDVRDLHVELANLPPDHPEHEVEFLHRQMNEEIDSLEIAARNLTDFPEADWALRMEIAKQCADESRHAMAFRRLMEKRGCPVGRYPVINFQFRIITMIKSLIGRLAVANRSFEASGIDAIQDGIASFSKKDDHEFVGLFDAQLADEVHHVRFANVWIERLIEREGGRAIMDLSRAIAHADRAFKVISGGNVTVYPVSAELRREAGFNDDEIETARAMVARQ
ncbi:Ferritin-like domain-containing protein [Sphingomonas antarctica]|uniref:DUF455 family protein n=1 Tax=Sphingomonas antarctica TaxID=2040274 RepID=UPI0039E984A8